MKSSEEHYCAGLEMDLSVKLTSVTLLVTFKIKAM